MFKQGQNIVSQSGWVSVASRGSNKIESFRRERNRRGKDERTDIGSRVFVSQGLRCSDVEASKTMESMPNVEPKCEL